MVYDSDEDRSKDEKTTYAVMTYRKGRTYTIESNINSSARKETVLDVLTDYPSHPEVFSSIVSSRVVTRDENEAHVLQEGRWNILWLSGRFQTLVRMREDVPNGRVTSRSLKSTVFHSHEGEWEVLPKASGGCQISHIGTSKLKGRLPPGLGRYLAGSFLSEENKIMIELKQAAEQRSATEKPEPQKPANAPFGWVLPQLRRDW